MMSRSYGLLAPTASGCASRFKFRRHGDFGLVLFRGLFPHIRDGSVLVGVPSTTVLLEVLGTLHSSAYVIAPVMPLLLVSPFIPFTKKFELLILGMSELMWPFTYL
jgi:hypothetical protein